MGWVQGRISRAINGNTRENKQKGVGDKSSRRLGKTKGAAKIPGEDFLRGMISDCETSGNADNVLCAGTPPSLVNFTTNE
jgi:hypothetical protein